MENYVVSARKYRPSDFNSIVGQSAIVKTLKNAIYSEQLAQAFLFCGSRGVGKTSCARILAKTINCFNRTGDTEACNECDSCVAFNEGRSLNIQELDAASNNSVDEMRSLTDQVRFAPQMGSHKIYIVDEVHMLSNAAFNAFLKTLEEPPSHAIFILATTEKHKIIPTILSRCQIFDFNRIGVTNIQQHLTSIAEKESINFDNESLHLIAQKSDGALRDALSMFDQLASFTSKNLTYSSVLEHLNVLDYDYYFKATDLLLTSDIPSLLLLLDKVIQKGFDPQIFINGLASHLRSLLVFKDKKTVELAEVADSLKDRYQHQSEVLEISFLLKCIEIFRQCDFQYRGSKNKRLLVELSLMQMASMPTENEVRAQKKKPYLKSTAEVQLNVTAEPKSSLYEEKNTEKKEDVKHLEVQNDVSEDKATPLIEPKNNIASEKSKQEIQTPARDVESFSPTSVIKKKVNHTSSLSIKNLTQNIEDEEVDNKENKGEEHNREFDEEALETVWKKLTLHFQEGIKEGDSIVYSALIKHKPTIEAHIISLKVDNKSQAEEFSYRRTEIHDYLRKELQNTQVELIISIERDKTNKKAYTSEEKFNEMAEKNPKLFDLKKALDLDFI